MVSPTTPLFFRSTVTLRRRTGRYLCEARLSGVYFFIFTNYCFLHTDCCSCTNVLYFYKEISSQSWIWFCALF